MCKRGDIYYVDFGNQKNSHIQQGIRPAIVVSNNKANDHSHLVTVVPLTKQVLTVDKFQLKNKVMTIREEAWLVRIDRALRVQIGV